VRRTSPSSVLFTTYNLLELDGSAARLDAVSGVIASLGTDVVAVQEILAPDPGMASARLRDLAGACGLRCEVPLAVGSPGAAAVAFGGHGFHVGLMWRDGIEPVPGSLRCLGGADFWHGLAVVTLDVGGTLVRHASFHATPFSRDLRASQNERLVGAVTRPPAPPVLVGADWNTVCADRVLTGGRWELYEPDDPYADADWFADLMYQCRWDYDEQGFRRHWADRRAGDVLWSGGLHDAAAVLRTPYQPTTGHHRDDVYAISGIARRIDAVRVTAPLIPALRGHFVTGSDAARAASDHLPVTVEYLPAALGA
jgi:endonuclease/exonuclease/phosphatase family metal-dependent hydrolase